MKRAVFTLALMFIAFKGAANESYQNRVNNERPGYQYTTDEKKKASEKEVADMVVELLKGYTEKLSSAGSVQELMDLVAEIKVEYDKLCEEYSAQISSIMDENKPKFDKLKNEINALIESLAKTAEKKAKEFIKENL